MKRSQKMTAAALQYGFSVLSGLATFAALKFLQHLSPSQEIFSRLSLIILSFTTFQIITDLGTQTEFLRSWHAAAPEKRKVLLHILIHTRMLLGVVAVATAAAYAVASDFSPDLMLSFLIYHFAFLPFALISTADSLFLAQHEYGKAIVSRVTRLLSLFVFIIAAALLPARAELISPLLSTLAFSVAALFVWVKFLKPVFRTNASESLLSSHWWTQSPELSKTFVHGSSIASVILGLQAIHGIAAHALMVRTIGEDRLTPLNTAVALSTPAILAFQTLVQIVNPSLPSWLPLTRREFVGRYSTFFLRSVFILIITSAGLWGANAAGLVTWFFPMTTYAVLPLCQFLIIAQWLLNLAVPSINLCQYQKRYFAVFTVLTAAIASALALQLWWNRQLLEHAYLLGLTVMGAFLALGTFTISVRGQPISKAGF